MLSRILPLLGNMEIILGDRGPVEDITLLVGVLSQLIGCLSLLIEVVLLLYLLCQLSVLSVVRLVILLVSAQIVT